MYRKKLFRINFRDINKKRSLYIEFIYTDVINILNSTDFIIITSSLKIVVVSVSKMYK